MKTILYIFLAVALSSCATYRDIMADRMTSAAEVESHVQAECTFLGVNDAKCIELKDAAVALWEVRQYTLILMRLNSGLSVN